MIQTLFKSEDWKSSLLTTVVIACCYAGAIQLNNLVLFNWLEFDRGRFLVFVPAGLKFLLLMCLRGAAVPGLILGITVACRGMFPELSLAGCLAMGLGLTLSAVLAIAGATRLLRVSFPWTQIHKGQLLALLAVMALADALASQWLLTALQLDTAEGFLREVGQGALGRMMGSILVLAAFVWLRRGAQPNLS